MIFYYQVICKMLFIIIMQLERLYKLCHPFFGIVKVNLFGVSGSRFYIWSNQTISNDIVFETV